MGWNFLIFLFLGSPKNVVFLLRDLKFLEFLLSMRYEKGRKVSYLIKSLYNSCGTQRDNNFIWRYFYFIFKNYIDIDINKEKNNTLNLKYLKIIILKDYINEIINFYEIQHIKRKEMMKVFGQKNEKNLINTMNFNFICNFLKIAKSILIEKDPKDFTPFTYNVNKFETLEKLVLIADIAFSEPF